MKKLFTIGLISYCMISFITLPSCNTTGLSGKEQQPDTFQFYVEKFADLKILRYKVPGFEDLSLNQKKLIYYLSQAALAGRDITWDQNGKYNLAIRRTLENIVETYKGDRTSNDFQKFMVYTKRVWFSNGIYHHYATDKFSPEFSKEYFNSLIEKSDPKGFPIIKGKTVLDLLAIIEPVIFDPTFLPKRVWLDPSKDLVENSAGNFYDRVSEKEAEAFYNAMKIAGDSQPLSYGLNSRLVKEKNKLTEKVWKSGGIYGQAIDQIIKNLELAKGFAENSQQAKLIECLISYYKTGDLKTWDRYNIEWISDTSHVDFVNGFIEVYGDPLGLKATWESIVNFKDVEATHRTEILSANAQWFEDNGPIDKQFKKPHVKGVSAKVITAAILAGELHPSTAIGINLPNADWIRKTHGSKSVTLENITYAYDQAAQKSGMLEEFASSPEEIEFTKKYGYLADNLHTDLHECLGHGSGQMNHGVTTDMLKNYYSTLEEARADLFALYYIMDPKMVELGVLPILEAGKAEYAYYIRNGLLTQLVRIEPGKNIEEAHMRNRQLIAKWCYEKGKADNVIEKFKKDDKSYVKINDYEKLRKLFGELLREVQRIKSEGDYEAGKALVENYGVIVDQILLTEVRERYAKLNLAPYSGFINPEYEPIMKNGEIIDVKVNYPMDFTKQMLDYAHKYSFLPTFN